MSEVINIPVKKIFPPYLLLRLVNKKSLAYLELKDSIRDVGLINSICVRPSPRKKGWYEIIDGMWRWSCHQDLGIELIPAIVKEATNIEVLKLQVQANAISAITKPIEYANHMKRLFMADHKLNFFKLSKLINKGPGWIKTTLGLLNLTPELSIKVDRGEIPITSAYMLAKFPKWLQLELEEDALLLSAGKFCKLCQDRIIANKNLTTNERKANFYKTQFEAHPYLQFFRTIVAEWKHGVVGPILLVKNNIITPIDAWKLALAWTLHMDADHIAEQEKRAQDKFDEMQDQILKRKEDRLDKKMISKLV